MPTITGTDTATIADTATVKNIWNVTASETIVVTDTCTVTNFVEMVGDDELSVSDTAIITDPKYTPVYNTTAVHNKTSIRLRQVIPRFIEANYV